MPGKSRQGKKKQQSMHKNKIRRMAAVAAVQQPPTAPPEAPKSPERVSVPVSSTAQIRYPHIHTELRRIAILSGVILAILVVLALVLS